MRMRRRPDAVDADAHRREELAQLGDVRLAGGMPDLGDAPGLRRGQQRRFRAGDRRLEQIHRRAVRPLGRFERVAGRVVDDARAHRDQRAQVRRDRAPRRKIAAGRRELRAPDAAEQRAEQQHRSAQPADQRGIRLRRRMSRHVTRSVVVPSPSTSAPSDRSSSIITATSRIRGTLRISQVSRRQQARRQQRQRRVLVAFDRDAAGEPPSASITR